MNRLNNCNIHPFIESNYLLCFLLVSVLFLSSNKLYSELVWDKKIATFEADVLDEQVVAIFPFVNNGKKEVEIRSISTSCGCTAGSSTRRIYHPGERGEIKAVFSFGSRTGYQKKGIKVETAQGNKSENSELEIRVQIPEKIVIVPRMLRWKVSESEIEKTSSLFVNPKLEYTYRDVSVDREGVLVSISPTDEDGMFLVKVTIAEEIRPGRFTISVFLESFDGEIFSVPLYCFVY